MHFPGTNREILKAFSTLTTKNSDVFIASWPKSGENSYHDRSAPLCHTTVVVYNQETLLKIFHRLLFHICFRKTYIYIIVIAIA